MLDWGGGGGYLAYPAALVATSISYVSPACLRRTSITGTLSHSSPPHPPLPSPQLCLKHRCAPIHRARTHAPLDHVGETVALNLSSSSPTSQKTTNPQLSSPSLHAGIPLATVVWWCLPSNQNLSFLYGHIALALQTSLDLSDCRVQIPCTSHLLVLHSCTSLCLSIPAHSFAGMLFSIKMGHFQAVHEIKGRTRCPTGLITGSA